MRAPIPPVEMERLAALRRYGVLDTPSEPSFDRIVELSARLFDVPMALVSLVDADRLWFKASVGLPIRETSRDLAFCAHTILSEAPLVVPDARIDARFQGSLLVTGAPHIRFYAGAPLRSPDGFLVGTLSVLDTKPRDLGERELATLVDLAALTVDELELRAAAWTRLTLEESLKDAQAKLEVLAVTDEMTGLPNYRRFRQRFSELIAEAQRGRAFGLAIVDIDDFKKVNDVHGHRFGDAILETAASALRDQVRAVDFVARYGGEEFCVLFADADAKSAVALAERLRMAVAACDGPVPVTASVGVCAYQPSFAEDEEALLLAAESALHRAKAAGRNRVAAWAG